MSRPSVFRLLWFFLYEDAVAQLTGMEWSFVAGRVRRRFGPLWLTHLDLDTPCDPTDLGEQPLAKACMQDGLLQAHLMFQATMNTLKRMTPESVHLLFLLAIQVKKANLMHMSKATIIIASGPP